MARWLAIVMLVPSGCGSVDRGARGETEAGGDRWQTLLRVEAEEFALSGRREIPVVFALRNLSRRVVQLDFPTEQHLEVTLRDAEGRVLFLWSEDRSFGSTPSQVVVNPGERLEFEATVPMRDMVAGRVYAVEAVLPGHPQTLATATLRPR